MSKIVKFLEFTWESIRNVLNALFDTLIVSSSISFLTLFGTPTKILRYWPGRLWESHFWCSSILMCFEKSFWIFISTPLGRGSEYSVLSSLQTSTTTYVSGVNTKIYGTARESAWVPFFNISVTIFWIIKVIRDALNLTSKIFSWSSIGSPVASNLSIAAITFSSYCPFLVFL